MKISIWLNPVGYMHEMETLIVGLHLFKKKKREIIINEIHRGNFQRARVPINSS